MIIMKYDAVIFDLDGTLLNTIEDIADAINQAFHNYGYTTSFSIEEVKTFLGSGAETLIAKAAQQIHAEEKEIPALYQEYKRIYNFNRTAKTKPYPNMVEILKALKDKGIRLAVLSNKPDNDTKACVQYYFPNIFDVVIGQRNEIPLKPDPNGVFEILHELHISRKNALFVGDMKQDKLTAENAKISFAACCYGFGGEEDLKDSVYKVNCVEDLLRLVEN